MQIRNDRSMIRVALACLPLMTCSLGFPQSPRWAKKATAFPEQCASWYPNKAQSCKPVRVVAPDGKRSVDVRYRKRIFSESAWVLQAYIRVTAPGKESLETALPESYSNVDLLWSPDSHAFFVNGDGDAGLWIYVYLSDDPMNRRDITDDAQRDMLKQFPACKAAFPNAEDATGCKKGSWPPSIGACMDEADPKYRPGYNMTGIDWITPSSVLVMAEIPGDTLYGGIMGQVMGYELQVPTGQIIKRIDAKHLKLEWQKSIAWHFKIPDPPKYCSTSDSPLPSNRDSEE